jgi:acetyltransferase-like isoleucine patch superfamily enzyme
MDLNAFVCKVWQGVASRVRQVALRAVGMDIQGHCWIQGIEWPLRPRCIQLCAGAMLDRRVVLLATANEARIVIGARSYLNRDVMIDASASVEIGPDVMIGPGCYLTDHDHVFNATGAPGSLPLVSAPTRIGARCWLGAHVTVLKGVTIGDGTVVGAGSVVTRSLPAGVIAVGNPARVLRQIAS